MLLIREVRQEDLDTLLDFAQLVGSGMTSFPPDLNTIQSRITDSIAGFSASNNDSEQTYFMVLEETDTGEVIGTTAIYTGIGTGKKPFYSFQKSKVVKHCNMIDRVEHLDLLFLVNDFTGATEYGTLILHPDYRVNANGAFLSRVRAMLLANDPSRFGDVIMAELRGYQDENGQSPFWENLGRKFFGLPFEEADHLSAVTDNRFIANMMPKYPIYTNLLPQNAIDVIGKPHNASAPAMKLLMSEGFVYNNYVDIFDAGPTVSCHLWNIKTVRDSQTNPFGRVDPTLSNITKETESMISTAEIKGFRSVRGRCRVELDGTVSLAPEVVEILGLSEGDLVRHILFKPQTDK